MFTGSGVQEGVEGGTSFAGYLDEFAVWAAKDSTRRAGKTER